MAIYIYILFHQIGIYCTETLVCTQVSIMHLKSLALSGFLELVFEVPLVVQIFKVVKKGEKDDANSNTKSE